MAAPVMTYEDHILNEEIKKGDVFRRVYKVVSEPKITPLGYEWKIYHRRCDGYMRMLRPDPSFFLSMNEMMTSDFIRSYQRLFIPMQLHPRIEAFYDVRRIGGSTALFTEWTERGTLLDCIKDGSLYQGTEAEVSERLLRISFQIARAAQFLGTEGVMDCAAVAENVMLTERWNAKLSVANRMVDGYEQHHDDNRKLWAHTLMQMYLGRIIPYDIDEIDEHYTDYRNSYKVEMPEKLEISVLAAIIEKLPDWEHAFVYLHLPLNREYENPYPGCRNNFALRLADCGKWEDAFSILDRLLNDHFHDQLIRYNLYLLDRYTSGLRKLEKTCGGVDSLDMIEGPTDILLYAEKNDRESVQKLIEKYSDDLPEYVARYLPEIREKLLDRPPMTRTEYKTDDPRLQITDDRIVVDMDGQSVVFQSLAEGSGQLPIPSKDGLVWLKDRLILPDSGILEDMDYTVKEFDGDRFFFDKGLTCLLAVSGDSIQLYPIAQYDNRFRAPFLLFRNDGYEDEI